MKSNRKDVNVAETLGMMHFANGGKCIPCQSKEINEMIKGLPFKQSIPIMRAFIRGWTKANLAAHIA